MVNADALKRYHVDRHQRLLLQRRSELFNRDAGSKAASDLEDEEEPATDTDPHEQVLYANADALDDVTEQAEYLTLLETINPSEHAETTQKQTSIGVQVNESDLPVITPRGRVQQMINRFTHADDSTETKTNSDVTLAPRTGMRATMYRGESWEGVQHVEVEANFFPGETLSHLEGESEC